jgi:hypothetical protein
LPISDIPAGAVLLILEERERQMGSMGYGRRERQKNIEGDEWSVTTDQDTFEIVLRVEYGQSRVNQASNLRHSKGIVMGQLETSHRQIMKNLASQQAGPRFDEWTKQRFEIEEKRTGLQSQLDDLAEIVAGATRAEHRFPKHLQGVSVLIGYCQ